MSRYCIFSSPFDILAKRVLRNRKRCRFFFQNPLLPGHLSARGRTSVRFAVSQLSRFRGNTRKKDSRHVAVTLLFLAQVIENISVRDRAVERPRGLSRGAKLAVVAAVLVAAGVAVAIPTIRKWSKAERSVAASSVRIGQVTRGDIVRDTSADGKIVAALHPTLFTPSAGIVALAIKAGDPV